MIQNQILNSVENSIHLGAIIGSQIQKKPALGSSICY